MKQKLLLVFCTLVVAFSLGAARSSTSVSGDYLEVRSCDVYTGPCFANAEMGLTGREGILVWNIRQGVWNGASLDGLSVIAVVGANDTLGDLRYEPRHGKAVLIVDTKADSRQREALKDFVLSNAGRLVKEVVDTRTAPMEVAIGSCSKSGCAKVKAGSLVEISTRCLGGNDHLCGNEDLYYPPLTEIQNAYPAFTELAAFKGSGLNVTWEATGQRSAYLGTFVR